MIQLNFLNAVAEDYGNGLIVNGKDLTSIISAALGKDLRYKVLKMRNVVGIVVRVSLAVKSTVLSVGLNTGDLKKNGYIKFKCSSYSKYGKIPAKGVIINHFRKCFLQYPTIPL